MAIPAVHYVRVIMDPQIELVPSDVRIKKYPGYRVVGSDTRTVACWCDAPHSRYCGIISRIRAWEQVFVERAAGSEEI